jgi:hypothetical protein
MYVLIKGKLMIILNSKYRTISENKYWEYVNISTFLKAFQHESLDFLSVIILTIRVCRVNNKGTFEALR